jgi:phage shock protein PspC (stress-responsive transcriptional regulator)
MASYCSACGVPLPAGARFCSACGKAVTQPGVVGAGSDWSRLSVRPRAGRKIAGVCRGLANQYGWDVTVTRVIAVLLAVLLFPVGLLGYGLLWLMMPEEPLVLATTTHLDTAT